MYVGLAPNNYTVEKSEICLINETVPFDDKGENTT